MDIFAVHDEVVSRYQQYVASFLSVADGRIREFVNRQLFAERGLWPDALVQLNPAYQSAATVESLVAAGILHPSCAGIFRTSDNQSLRLYRHQEEAIRLGAKGEHFVVTSGTGSGKTLTYFLPIFDAVLRGDPSKSKVWAIVVYPMNALVNSQEEALKGLAEAYLKRTGQALPVRFAKYTGQETDAEKRHLQQDPPHILLTNYVMLELMLVRPRERHFVDRASSALHFLVMDELHTYRGRQGADVAMLIRRLRERSGNPHLTCIGTSATMVSAEDGAKRSEAVAGFATRFFGVEVKPQNVVEEHLRPIISADSLPNAAALRAGLAAPLPPVGDWEAFAANPLNVWAEYTFGIRRDPAGVYRRQIPVSLKEGAQQLADLTGVDAAVCEARLHDLLLLGAGMPQQDGSPPFAYKLHQFISQGRAVYATLEAPPDRLLTLEGQFYAPGRGDALLFPLQFCRVCGQEYYAVHRHPEEGRLTPRVENSQEADAGTEGDGYLMLDSGGRWQDDPAALPEHWFEPSKPGKLKKEYAAHRPKLLYVRPNGAVSSSPEAGARPVWWQPGPFMLCQSCGEAYTLRDKSDFRKLSELSSEGRSTATTLLTLSSIGAMRTTDLAREAQKVLSFTDNRQDASLQAGHFNDFVQVARVRTALYQAMQKYGELRFDNAAGRVVEALGLEVGDYARAGKDQPINPHSAQADNTRKAFVERITYRLYEDLRRGWRVVQPNLEQCGLLKIDYVGMDELAANPQAWAKTPLVAGLTAQERSFLLSTLLDEMRRQSTIDAACLRRNDQEELKTRTASYLNEDWAFGPKERLRFASYFVLPGEERSRGDFSLSSRSVIGRWLKGYFKAQLGRNLDTSDYDTLIKGIADVLVAERLLGRGSEGTGRAEQGGLQLRADALLWRPGDGEPIPNPLRRYRGKGEDYAPVAEGANTFFRDFYQGAGPLLAGMSGAAHTAQVKQEKREEREVLFRSGSLPALFCSPTMELGVDIRDLNAVHLRNVPPTPANYAQRSGRAGRAGQPALILTYCSARSGHDQYFFNRRDRMVAGAVTAPRLDLGNEDLVRAHIDAIWLAHTGLSFTADSGSLLGVANTDAAGLPLRSEIAEQANLPPHKQAACLAECRRVLTACGADVQDADWMVDGWLEAQIAGAVERFDRALDRWRTLYQAANAQLQQAFNQIMLSYSKAGKASVEARQEAERVQREAQRQLDLLACQNARTQESDFSAYRYLASEGFLPGYNFPALPVRAFVAGDGEGEFIARPRFLAINEFGPDNVIYHEGAKHQVNRVLLPAQDPEKLLVRAKVCRLCGYLHEGEAVHDERCHNCEALLETTGDHIANLLEIANVGTQRRDRITSDEEERMRRGYDILTNYRFAEDTNGQPRRRRAKTYATGDATEDKQPLLELTYAPAATLWRINHGWRRSPDRKGYRLDLRSGRWIGQNGEDDGDAATGQNTAGPEIKPGVRLFVRGTANVLLVYPHGVDEAALKNPSFLPSLQYALGRGIQELFEVEGSELASERIGEGAAQGILFWENSEGGLGVLRRIVQEPAALAAVARRALEVLHFDPDSGEDLRPAGRENDSETPCGRACYECLLSYYNQRDHRLLDRHAVQDALRALAGSVTEMGGATDDYDAHYRRLRQQTDSRSELERTVIDHLYRTRRRLPDSAQIPLPNVMTVPDFFYEPNVCVYCDGSVHDEPQQRAIDESVRGELKAQGQRVIVLRYDADLEADLARYADVFGRGDQRR